MRSKDCWLPKLERLSDYNNDNLIYENALYNIFVSDFINSKPKYKNKDVVPKIFPKRNNKEESFYHITTHDTNNQNNRVLDMNRCERIRWIRAFIENYNCDKTKCTNCSGVIVWEEPYHNKNRVHFLFKDEKYIVVIEERNKYYILITAFYLNNTYLHKKLVKYNIYKTN